MKDSSPESIDRKFYDSIEHRTWKYYEKEYQEKVKNSLPLVTSIKDEISRMYGEYMTLDFTNKILFILDFSCSVKAHSQDIIMQDIVGKDTLLTTKHVYPWVNFDDNSISFFLVVLKRSAFNADKPMLLRGKRIFEAGVSRMVQVVIGSRKNRFMDMMPGLKDRRQEMRECLEFSKKLKIKEIGFQPIKLINLKRIGVLYCTILFLIQVSYQIERIIKSRRLL